MSLSNKYNIPQETVNKMVKDGVIPCSVIRHEQIYEIYKAYKAKHSWKSESEIRFDLSEQLKISDSTIKGIVSKMKFI